MEQPTANIFENRDVVIRLMEYLGPRHVCLSLGSTCRTLHRLSQSNSLWKIFWMRRCLYTKSTNNGEYDRYTADNNSHGAANVFRHAIYEMNLVEKLKLFSFMSILQDRNSAQQSYDQDNDNTLYLAYVQQHTSMKLTNLRVQPFRQHQHTATKPLGQQAVKLGSPVCTQTWPGQLSLIENIMDEDVNNNTRITCLNPAESWCDHPNCNHARCGTQGCLRCYRFLPRDYSMSAGGTIMSRECTERSYDFLSFVKCSWCSVSFCNEHVGVARNRNVEQGQHTTPAWYKCDECNLSSCPDCVSQVFLSPPDMDGCNVVIADNTCHRKICKECTWFVGRKKNQQNISMNIPGGDYTQQIASESAIITVKGSSKETKEIEWEEVETCCSKCLRHVEFRWRELAQMQDSFGGLMP